MAEWGLSYEPWTYLVDGAGKIVARYDGPLALSEIRPQIEALLAPS
jgi:glutathione peroxidase-family protein